ncbi:MAG TPA: hypothetical protein VMB81_31870 [Candidatus Sulfotelmatobacter sp.]|nr:hypothetical protein [Candidatus Sulfotelmatobacter sp.]
MAGDVTRDCARPWSRAEIDARARAVRVALERHAGVHGGARADAPFRLAVLPVAIGALWRRIAGSGEPVLAPVREAPPPRREPFA